MNKWPKWYTDRINRYTQYLNDNQRKLAREAASLINQSVDVGVIATKHHYDGTPTPEGYIDNSCELFRQGIEKYHQSGIDELKECYQCDTPVFYLFGDSRCASCTRLSISDVTGED